MAEDLEDLTGAGRGRIRCQASSHPDAAGSPRWPSAADADHAGKGGGGRCFHDEPVALADEEIARIQRHGNAVLFVRCRLTITVSVAVFDVVVNE